MVSGGLMSGGVTDPLCLSPLPHPQGPTAPTWRASPPPTSRMIRCGAESRPERRSSPSRWPTRGSARWRRARRWSARWVTTGVTAGVTGVMTATLIPPMHVVQGLAWHRSYCYDNDITTKVNAISTFVYNYKRNR